MSNTCPTTPKTAIHQPKTPHAPKKPKADTLKFLQPVVYKPKAEKMRKEEDTIIDALARAGVLKALQPKKKARSAPRKLTVSIIDGHTGRMITKYVPIHRLISISSRAAEFLNPRPTVTEYKIYGKYNFSVLANVINSITLSHDLPIAADLPSNLLTYEACLRLGINFTHAFVKPLLAAINVQISSTLTDAEILTFVTYRISAVDPVFTHMANVLCHRRFTGSIGDVPSFEKMVAKKVVLQEVMVQIDQSHKERRKAINASKWARKAPDVQPQAGKGIDKEKLNEEQKVLLKLFKGE
ncbi:hypothetical protein C7974DRAFT_174235 [Boeremia exigua]|uniref:uncharacterized protein n=1 Tax=Boeremia exigua TaxID=749465 RepID=UPI001E8E4829|nr:uncharacterized protein C7974DRAFT_174235 [Boeremia exigua]KAH6633556.1 hypothetical protein C7974DRAFT_174235 [Boeremia exigua]